MICIVPDELPIQTVGETQNQIIKASQRISAAFLELLEQQFPIHKHHTIRLRSASQFAHHLNIHVNHLNKSIKGILNKTTTQVISERILKEAKILLRHDHLSVADIAYDLGFTETTHFCNFFRKHTRINPRKFRTA
ncbi:MAG TPA: helix-turn-helix transcriptional regulator [Chitinophagaceae bacterium]|nr:helix-turn-helix transcriptional regulator [Chitinophagaceae bacterium]